MKWCQFQLHTLWLHLLVQVVGVLILDRVGPQSLWFFRNYHLSSNIFGNIQSGSSDSGRQEGEEMDHQRLPSERGEDFFIIGIDDPILYKLVTVDFRSDARYDHTQGLNRPPYCVRPISITILNKFWWYLQNGNAYQGFITELLCISFSLYPVQSSNNRGVTTCNRTPSGSSKLNLMSAPSNFTLLMHLSQQ